MARPNPIRTGEYEDKPEKTVRHVAIQAFDADDDKGLKGKEMKRFKEAHPKMYDNLMEFCPAAKERPKAHDVRFPAGEKEKSFKCKKKRVDRPYLMAWARKGEPAK